MSQRRRLLENAPNGYHYRQQVRSAKSDKPIFDLPMGLVHGRRLAPAAGEAEPLFLGAEADERTSKTLCVNHLDLQQTTLLITGSTALRHYQRSPYY